MNSIQASRLIQILENQNIDYAKPILSQLHKIFVFSFWDESITLRNSWKGRIASFLERPSEYVKNNKKIDQVFSKAIRLVVTDPIKSNKFNPVLTFKLIEEFNDESIGQSPHVLDPALLSSPENQFLKKQKEEKNALHWSKISRFSYLHNSSTSENPKVDLKILLALKSYNGATNPVEALDYLEQFLQNNPEYGVVNWKARLQDIREACLFDEKICSQFQCSPTFKVEEQAKINQKQAKLLLNLTTQLTNAISELDSSKKEKKLIQFSYGPKVLTIASFLELMRKVPEPLLESVSQQYKKLLLSDELESIETIGEKFVRSFFNKLRSSQISLEKLKPLGKDVSRKIPDTLAQKLPKLFEIWLENCIKKGLVGNLSALMPKEYSQILDWLSDQSDFLQDAEALEKIENLSVDFFKKKFQAYHQKYGDALINFFKMSQTVLSPQLMELFGVDQIMVSGPLWMEFEKILNGTYNITIYTLGNSLNYHPIDLPTGKQYGVMRLKNIKAEKLNKEFFFSLLKRHLNPINDPLTASKAYDIYAGPLKTLEASVDKNHPDDPKDLESIPSTNWQLSLNLLLKQGCKNSNALLQVYFQAIVGFCRTHMQNEMLVFHDIEACKALVPILEQIDKHLILSDLSQSEKKRIKATCTEIRFAIFNCNKKNESVTLEKTLLKSLHEYLSKISLSQKQLLEYRGILCYFFGDEVGEFIDHISENSAHLLPEECLVSSNPSKYTDQLYIGMYANIIRHALQLATIGIGFAYRGWISLLAFGGFWYLLPVPILDKIIPYIIPSKGIEWYERLKDAMSRKLYELLLVGGLFVISKTRRENIKKQFLAWRNSVKETTAILQGKKTVFYHLPAFLPTTKAKTPQKNYSIKSNLFKQGLKGLNRFCRLKLIECVGVGGTNHISKIIFNKNLVFHVKPNSQGILEAVSDKIPNFHIAENQDAEALRKIPNYLLLENNEGKQKVLILKNQSLQSLIGRLAFFTGPFSEIWMNTTASINSRVDKYFIFDLEPCRSVKEKSILKSSDPEAVLYLLCLYYFLNNKKALKLTQHQFDWICNHHPIPNSILQYIVPLAMIPFDLKGLRQFRRWLFSLIGQNQLRFKTPSSLNDSRGKNLILGIVTLIDLSTFDSKNSREELSIFQEYCLYKFAFRMLASILKTPSKILNQVVEESKLEALIELVGLSNHLINRYSQIKNILGVQESWKLWGAKHALKIIKTPSTLTEDVSYGDPSESFSLRDEKYSVYITRLLSYCRNIKESYIKFLKIDELSQVMDCKLESIPKLKADKMTPELIKKQFPAYYSMARNDSVMICSLLERQQLIHSLHLLKGMGDKQTQVLIHYLHTSVLYSENCPSTNDLILALHEVKANSKKNSKFLGFFKELNEITFGKLMEKDFSDAHIHPLTQFIGKYMTASAVTNLLVSPQMFPPGLEQVGTDMVTSALKFLIIEKFQDVTDPLFKQINSSEAFIEKSNGNSVIRGASRVLNAVAPLWVIWNAYDYANHFKNHYLTPPSQVEEMQSTLCYLAYKSLTIVGTAFLRVALAKAMKKKLKLSSLFVFPTWYYSLLIPPIIKLGNKTYNYLKPQFASTRNNGNSSSRNSLEEPYAEARKQKINSSLFEETDTPIRKFLIEQHHAFAFKNPVNKKSILILYLNLRDFVTKLTQHIKEEKTRVGEFFNKPIKFKGYHLVSLSFHDIEILVENGMFEKMSKKIGFSKPDFFKLELAIARINYKKVRLKQLKELLGQVRFLLNENNSSKFSDEVERLSKNLQSSAVSPLQHVPEKHLWTYIQHQASSKTDLVPFDTFSNSPSTTLFQAGTLKFILIDDPAKLHSVHQELLDIFGLQPCVLKINREMSLSPHHLQTILTSHVDLQRLQSIFIDRMYSYSHQKNEQKPGDKDCLIFIKQILTLIKQYGKIPKHRVSTPQPTYPIRKLKIIKENFYNITQSCIKLIIQDQDLGPLLKNNILSTMDVQTYHDTVKPRLAEQMNLLHFKFRFIDHSQQKDITDFVCDRLIEVPAWIRADHTLFSEISLIKGIFHHMLPLRIVGKHFDNNNSMKIPYESLFYEGLSILSSKLTQVQALELAKIIETSANTQMKKSDIDFKQTYVYQKFGHLAMNLCNAFGKYKSSHLSELIQHPQSNLTYFKSSVWPKCTYWKYAIQNTLTDFESLFDGPPLKPKQEAYHKILAVPNHDFKTWMNIYEKYEDDLIDTTEDDPANLFGFTSYQANQPGFINPLIDLGIQQQLELTKSQLEEKTFQNDSTPKPSRVQIESPFQEKNWPSIDHPLKLDWLKISSPSKKPSHTDMCLFFKVQDLLFEAKSSCFSKIAFMFDYRLWMSNNFVRRWNSTLNNTPADIGSFQQRRLENVIVHLTKVDGKVQIIGMGPLTIQEEELWKSKLSNISRNDDSEAIIYHASGTQNPFNMKGIDWPDFMTLISQLKFLNGDLDYFHAYSHMLKWVLKHDPKNLKEAFQIIHGERNTVQLRGHDVDHIFIQACGLEYDI